MYCRKQQISRSDRTRQRNTIECISSLLTLWDVNIRDNKDEHLCTLSDGGLCFELVSAAAIENAVTMRPPVMIDGDTKKKRLSMPDIL